MSKLKKLLWPVLLAISYHTNAQSTFSATSHSATIQGNTYEYVIGEMTLVSTERTSNLIVTQGFLQPNDSKRPVSTNLSDANEVIKIYPNPTQDIVYVDPQTEFSGVLKYQLFDATGKVLFKNEHAQSERFSVDLRSYASGNYYLMITSTSNSSEQSYSYKIQKK